MNLDRSVVRVREFLLAQWNRLHSGIEECFGEDEPSNQRSVNPIVIGQPTPGNLNPSFTGNQPDKPPILSPKPSSPKGNQSYIASRWNTMYDCKACCVNVKSTMIKHRNIKE